MDIYFVATVSIVKSKQRYTVTPQIKYYKNIASTSNKKVTKILLKIF